MSFDFFKILPLRLMGFGFAASEALRYRFSYKNADFLNKLTAAYVVVHVVHVIIVDSTFPRVIGAICFEGLCTCLIPPVTTYHICSFVSDLAWHMDGLPNVVKSWAPVVVGLLTIPFYLMVVDPLVDDFIETNIVAFL